MARGSTSQRRRSPSPTSSNEADNPVGGMEELDLKGKEPIQVGKHFFLQNMISRKVVSSELAEIMYKDSIRLCGVEDAPSLADFIQSIEAGINLIGLEIKQVNDQETGKILYVLSNSTQDAPAKIATEYKAEEIAFFKSIVEKIMLARDMSYCVTQVDAIKGAKGITKMVAIQLIKSFLAKGWLALHPSGRLILSPRSLLELAPYLRETYRDDDDDDLEPRERTIVDCNRCLKIVTSGYACPNPECTVRLHTFCVGARINQSSGQCPDRLSNPESPCTQVWKKDPVTKKYVGHPIGVSALGLGGDEGHPTSQMSDDDDEPPAKDKKGKKKSAVKGGGGGKKATKGKGKKKAVEEDEDEEMDDDEEEDEDDSDGAGSATQSAARRSSSRAAAAAGKSKRRAIRDDNEEEEDQDEEMEE